MSTTTTHEDPPAQRLPQRVAGDDRETRSPAVAADERRGRRPRGRRARRGRRRSARRPPPARRRAAARRRGAAVGNAADPSAVSTSTPRGRASSPGVPAATTCPRSRITTRSQTSSISESRCELSSTATPRRASSSSSSRTVRRPAGSSALVGSSSSSSRGDPTSAWAIPSRCCMPFDIVSTRRARARPRGRRARAAPSRSAAPPADPARRWCSSSTSSAPAPAREAEQLGEIAERAPAPAGSRPERRRPRPCPRRADQAARDLHQRRFARAVRSEQADELALADLEVDPGERLDGAVALHEAGAAERGCHRRRVYAAGQAFLDPTNMPITVTTWLSTRSSQSRRRARICFCVLSTPRRSG